MTNTESKLAGINIFPSESVFKSHQHELTDGELAVVPVDCESLRGKSAYELAVERGFEGTASEWLLTLRGVPGPTSGGLPVGFEYFSINPNIPSDSLPLIGKLHNRETFPLLWEHIQYQPNYLITEEEWQALYSSNNGNVPYYSSGDGGTTFRVPSLSCYIEGTNDVNHIGSYCESTYGVGTEPKFSTIKGIWLVKACLSKPDAKNNIKIVETYQNDTSWYRIWSDGWIEQGGKELFPSDVTSASYTTTVTFLKAFKTAPYVGISFEYGGTKLSNAAYRYINPFNVTTESFDIILYNPDCTGTSWYACGQGDLIDSNENLSGPSIATKDEVNSIVQNAINEVVLHGIHGASAYEIAQKNGFKGTEFEWLLSLRGTPGESGSGLPVGFEYFSINPNLPSGSLPLFGGIYSREVYSALWEYAKSQPNYLISEEQWQALSSSNNGNVPFYSVGDGETTFRVPSLNCWVKGANGLEEVGSFLEAGLPNIEGSITGTDYSLFSASDIVNKGALTASGEDYTSAGTSSKSTYKNKLTLDASSSNPIYGNSDTVQPPSIVGMWLVKAYGTVINEGNLEISAIETRLNQIEELLGSIDSKLENL